MPGGGGMQIIKGKRSKETHEHARKGGGAIGELGGGKWRVDRTGQGGGCNSPRRGDWVHLAAVGKKLGGDIYRLGDPRPSTT